MLLTEQHIIKKTDLRYQTLDTLMFKSKNLYNCALYEVRQHFFETKKYLNYYSVNSSLKNNEWYKSLPSQSSQQILMLLDQNFKSFFVLLKKKRSNDYEEKINIPKYLSKEGRFMISYHSNNLSKKFLAKGIVKIPKTNLSFQTSKENIKQVRFIPRNNHILMEIVYEMQETKLKEDNSRYLSIDCGVNNLATCTSNVIQPFIINGRPLKSYNQYYNKKLASIKSDLQIKHKTKWSNKTRKLTQKRNNKVKDYLHKASKAIINQAVTNSLNTIIIGQNKGWKQEINIGRRNNQTFVQIPFAQLIQQIIYKAKIVGINVVCQEESYTSKASALDNDQMPTYSKKKAVDQSEKSFSGKRIGRGLYKSADGRKLNADVNGSLNIMRKALKVSFDDLISPECRGLVFNPVKVNL